MLEPPDLYLASTSPRRRELLSQAGLRFSLCEPGPEYVDAAGEHLGEAGDPMQLAQQRARRKAVGARPHDLTVPVLAVDTVVDLDGCELGQAVDRATACALLQRLAGRRHRVHTAHCLVTAGRVAEELATAIVACRTPDRAELVNYVDSEQWRGKAGGYGIQDPAQNFLTLVEGSFDTVVGLHVAAVLRLLQMQRGEGRS